MKVRFEYRSADEGTEHARFIAINNMTDERWEVLIKLPFPFGHSFWSEPQDSETVVQKSLKLAKKHRAPDWVVECH